MINDEGQAAPVVRVGPGVGREVWNVCRTTRLVSRATAHRAAAATNCPPRLWTKDPCCPCHGLRCEARVNSVTPMGITTQHRIVATPDPVDKVEGAAMPWVRGHYARSSRTRRRSESTVVLVGVAMVVLIVVIWYFSR
jgi:hypothetical protein